MTISEVAGKFELSTDTLRYYEKVGMIPSVGRTGGGIRNYSVSDIGWVEFIKCMRSAGISIEVLTEYVSLYQMGDVTTNQRKELLINERNKIAKRSEELIVILQRLDYKIENYDKIEDTIISKTNLQLSTEK